jgi:hypothetical protein
MVKNQKIGPLTTSPLLLTKTGIRAKIKMDSVLMVWLKNRFSKRYKGIKVANPKRSEIDLAAIIQS